MRNTDAASDNARGHFLGFISRAVSVTLMLGATSFGTPALGQALKAGDMVYADSGDWTTGGGIIKVDGATGQKTIISSGGLLHMPWDVVIAGGAIVVSDSSRLISIDPATGAQTLLADNSNGTLGYPYGMALNRSGGVLAANLAGIIQVDPSTGLVHPFATGGFLGFPLDVAVASNGQIFILNISSTGRQIIAINPSTGVQRIVTQGGYLKNSQAIAVQGNDIYVTDVATADGNFGCGCIIHVNAQTGAQSILSRGSNLVGPVGITISANGQLIVSDPYTVNPQSSDLVDGGYDGAIISINMKDGSQTVLARGEGSFVNPCGVAVVTGK